MFSYIYIYMRIYIYIHTHIYIGVNAITMLFKKNQPKDKSRKINFLPLKIKWTFNDCPNKYFQQKAVFSDIEWGFSFEIILRYGL